MSADDFVSEDAGHIGDRLRAGREAAGLSRTHIKDMTGISVAKVARIELTGKGTEQELDLYRGALRGALGDVLVGADSTDDGRAVDHRASVQPTKPFQTDSPPVTGYGSDGSVRLVEWNGFKRGDVVKVKGLDGQYRFCFYHEDDHQRYVEVSGPLVRFRDQIVGTRIRCVEPERITPTRSRARK